VEEPALLDLLRLAMTPGLGPVLIARALAEFGSARAVVDAGESGLRRVRGIGAEKARAIAAGFAGAAEAARRELDLAETLGVALVALGDPDYPPLLAEVPDPPPILYVLGAIEPAGADRYPVAIVGSRSCTVYGREQAARFAAHLGRHGLTVVSGGARGIDSAAHEGALAAGGRSIAVLGCGLAHRYPPDNAPLFDAIAAGRGALVSELPLGTPPASENFPARNRIISGLTLGVIVIEAGRRSGALITARHALEEHNREVFALPGRVDSPASQGSLDLLRAGAAALVVHPADVIEALESPARHLHIGTHADRFAAVRASEDGGPARDGGAPGAGTDAGREPAARGLFAAGGSAVRAGQPAAAATIGVGTAALTESQRRLLAALTDAALSLDELARVTGAEPGALRSDLTILELARQVRRAGSRIVRVQP